ncbi:hypothetical protein [Glycomyces terrestris]|uniref:Uncharacterized protein n=1 Tax=Glycomyces terrestris TaxID=2493553 RepID=A0A426V412_9ACTN|nr:hypothetical protein [Glycomyces terrestris]RRS01607.1 hypothetical protein EIW28_02230 [Glycomyces terrestris]
MRRETIYLAAGIAVAVLAIGIALAAGLRGGDSGEPTPDPGGTGLIRPTEPPTGLLTGEELESYWDDDRRSSAEPPEATE